MHTLGLQSSMYDLPSLAHTVTFLGLCRDGKTSTCKDDMHHDYAISEFDADTLLLHNDWTLGIAIMLNLNTCLQILMKVNTALSLRGSLRI